VYLEMTLYVFRPGKAGHANKDKFFGWFFKDEMFETFNPTGLASASISRN
jgi:hypothetical protein